MTIFEINRAIADVISADKYPTLTIIERDAEGRVSNVQSNVEQMNILAGVIALTAQEYIGEVSHAGVGVPLGTFSGLPVLNGLGPDVPLRTLPIGAVFCTFETEFRGQGINQTVHRIVLRARSVMNLVMPLGMRNVKTEIEILLCENIIVGAVPDWYMAR